MSSMFIEVNAPPLGTRQTFETKSVPIRTSRDGLLFRIQSHTADASVPSADGSDRHSAASIVGR
jgi:hypothetical protein